MEKKLPLKILNLLADMDRKGLSVESILGAVLKGISKNKEDKKEIEITKLNLKEVIMALTDLAPVFQTSCETTFRDYLQENTNKYVINKQAIDKKELIDFNTFIEKNSDIIQVKESDILNYFNSIFSNTEKSKNHAILYFGTKLKDGSIIPAMLCSNKTTLDRVSEFNKIFDSKVYINSFFYSNILSYFVYSRIEDLSKNSETYLSLDIAETAAQGYMLSQAVNILREYMDKNLEELFSNFF